MFEIFCSLISSIYSLMFFFILIPNFAWWRLTSILTNEKKWKPHCTQIQRRCGVLRSTWVECIKLSLCLWYHEDLHNTSQFIFKSSGSNISRCSQQQIIEIIMASRCMQVSWFKTSLPHPLFIFCIEKKSICRCMRLQNVWQASVSSKMNEISIWLFAT